MDHAKGEAVSGETVKVSDLLKSPRKDTELDGTYEYDDFKGEAKCHWRLHVAPAGIDVRGTLRAEVELECGRCLSPFIVPVDADIDERLVFSRFIEPASREQEMRFSDYAEVIDEDSTLDLKDLAHQYLIMELSGEIFCDSDACCVQAGA